MNTLSAVTPTTDTEAETLTKLLANWLPPGSLGAVRLISPDDDQRLTAIEGSHLPSAVPCVKRASGAGRYLARSLCRQMGIQVESIPRFPSGDPCWPASIVGSIAHDASLVAVAVVSAKAINGIGIDIEPAEHLEAGLLEHLSLPGEMKQLSGLPFSDKALFSIKEAVYKAVFPKEQIFLEFTDILITDGNRARVPNSELAVHWRVLTKPRVLAFAWW
jgi:4'-phosphopantetheinyl transferase EntD